MEVNGWSSAGRCCAGMASVRSARARRPCHRVMADPAGEIVADPGRGLMMGNSRRLHGRGRDLGVSHWRWTLWICCVLDGKDVWRSDAAGPVDRAVIRR